MHYDMEDLIEQANEVQESMSRTYGVPDEVDEADLEAGELSPHCSCQVSSRSHCIALDDSQNSMRLEMTLQRRNKGFLRI